ncbi:hypothetical protein BGZ50_006509 [Haplosporangium sp. Z 11]|nr:hypothetical protein BGZ50_006509 [Haplosporangium sp. Z 11]
MDIQESRINALDLPEIRDYLGNFLGNKELLQCIRVCKQWHQSFEPFLYHTVDPANGFLDSSAYDKSLSFDKLIRHRSHVRSLTIQDGFLPVSPLPVHFNNLKFVCLYPFVKRPLFGRAKVDPVYQRQIQTRAAEFIQQRIDLFYFDDLPDMGFWIPLVGAPRMRELYIAMGSIKDHNHARAFWQACTGLTTLYLNGVIIPNPWGRSYYSKRQQMPSFPRLLELVMYQFGMDIEDQIQLLRQCPRLRKLTWVSDYNFGQDHSDNAAIPGPIARIVDHLSAMAAESHLQHLKYLKLILTQTHPSLNESLMRLLDHLPPLVHLVLSAWGINAGPFHSLERHFLTLKSLDLAFVTSSESSRAIQMVMVSCPLLECLYADILRVSDVLTDIQRGQPWICLRLNTLHLHIEIDYPACLMPKDACQLFILEQLAQFPHMRILHLKGQRAEDSDYGMDLRLSKGLDLLGCWAKLEAIGFPSIVQEWSNNEVDWVLERWSCLDTIWGTIHKDTVIRRALQERLLSSGIKFQ